MKVKVVVGIPYETIMEIDDEFLPLVNKYEFDPLRGKLESVCIKSMENYYFNVMEDEEPELLSVTTLDGDPLYEL